MTLRHVLQSNVLQKTEADIENLLLDIAVKTRKASRALKTASTESKNFALQQAAKIIRQDSAAILKANDIDIRMARKNNRSKTFIERLKLDENRIEAICKSLDTIVALADPVGEEIQRWRQPSGLDITQLRTPIGVIGMIYESRPNVTIDAAALAVKSGNAVLLRCGSETIQSALMLIKCFQQALQRASLPCDCAQLVPITDRYCVTLMLSGLKGNIDVIVPRGGRSLVERVMTEAKVPVIGHNEGLCHIFIEHSAPLDMASEIVINAKLRRTSVCGALETLLIDTDYAEANTVKLLTALQQAGCEVRGCARTCRIFSQAKSATEQDWQTEYCEPIVAVRLVDGVKQAVEHIQRYSSEHTEAIVTRNQTSVDYFFTHLDSAILMHNCSTQFADGGEFGFGAEIGIATTKIHARGPIGLRQLTSFRYLVRAGIDGLTRPL